MKKQRHHQLNSQSEGRAWLSKISEKSDEDWRRNLVETVDFKAEETDLNFKDWT